MYRIAGLALILETKAVGSVGKDGIALFKSHRINHETNSSNGLYEFGMVIRVYFSAKPGEANINDII
jgi:hypothetical protein